jgi:hypothetical protein
LNETSERVNDASALTIFPTVMGVSSLGKVSANFMSPVFNVEVVLEQIF